MRLQGSYFNPLMTSRWPRSGDLAAQQHILSWSQNQVKSRTPLSTLASPKPIQSTSMSTGRIIHRPWNLLVSFQSKTQGARSILTCFVGPGNSRVLDRSWGMHVRSRNANSRQIATSEVCECGAKISELSSSDSTNYKKCWLMG